VLRRKLRDALSAPFERDTEEDGGEDGDCEPEEVRPKKRGAPKGHRGATRPKPEREPDRIVEVRPAECPHCGSRNVSDCRQTEEHTQEDIVLVRPVATRFVKHRGYCRDCERAFFPRGNGERPKGYIGPVAAAVAGYLRYGVKMPFASVRKMFGDLWGLPITEPALAGFDKRLARTGRPFYEKLGDLVRCGAGVNVDETSWPRGSATEWLWTFVNRDCAFFRIAPSRAGTVAKEVLGEDYGGILSSDCFSAYNTLQAKGKQKCLAHYKRTADDLEKFHPEDESAKRFAASLKDIFKRARQCRREWLADGLSDARAEREAGAFRDELDRLLDTSFKNKDTENLRRRLARHRGENFNFLLCKHVDPDNNRAESSLRPSVVMRKITYGNNSRTGARNHETLMSLVETAKLRKTDPLKLMMALAADNSEGVEDSLFGKRSADACTRIRPPPS